ncbi:MAG: UDP-3-O-[3-hydroxymyristoyl] glucosamine N-acyltransferase [Planctomycetota bacterium]|jgi:UDP-3-O-[3-hydroxymyristoyl] glucosamine N-acyltransferase
MPSYTLTEIAELCGARVEGDGTRVVLGPAGLLEAGAQEISFLAESRYRADLDKTQAAGVLVAEDLDVSVGETTLLRCANPGRAFSQVILAFSPPAERPQPGIHPSAVVHADAQLAADVHVGPLCVVSAGAELGAGCVLHSRVSVGRNAHIGAGCELHPGVVLYAGVSMGADCILHAGVVIGADGFGFEPTAEGWVKTPQGGTVILGERVEVGANATIDCARFGATRIGSGTKIDNLVHVAHNVQMGESCLLIAQTGVAGSTRLGQRVILAGQAGVAGHLSLGDGARIGGGTKVFKDVAAGQDVWGFPAMPKGDAMRAYAALPKLVEELRSLKRRLAALEEDQA